MGLNNWKAELSLLDESFGKQPKYPLATQIEHQKYEFYKQNELLKGLTLIQQNEIKNTTSLVCGSIENGFNLLYKTNSKGFEKIISNIDKLSDNLEDIDRSLDKINSTLSWGFASLLEQLTISNNKLNQIIQLLHIPDSQKQRKYHIEQGFEFMKKAVYETSLYEFAKEHFEEAVKIEKTDYLCLQQLGIIHLYRKEFLDLNLSKEYFNKSIMLSKSDINYNKNIQNPSSFNFTYNPSKLTALSYKHLARINFIEENYNDAFDNARNGINFFEMLSMYYDLSIYSLKKNDKRGSLLFLTKAITMDRYITIKATNDKYLNLDSDINSFLNSLAMNYINLANDNLNKLKKLSHPNTSFKNAINHIEQLIKNNNYIDALNALESIGYVLKN